MTEPFSAPGAHASGRRVLLSGRSVSPGLGEGFAFLHSDPLGELDLPTAILTRDIESELGYLEEATETITEDLRRLSRRVEREMDAQLAAVFDAHQAIVNDPVLRQELQAEVRLNLMSAGSAVKAVFLRWEKRFLLMESQVARHKGDDMRDLSHRLSSALAGRRVHPLEEFPPGGIFVASRLLPSESVFLSRQKVAGVLLEYGSVGSHAALFVREMGVPCVGNLASVLERVPAACPMLLDATAGEVILHPDASDRRAHQAKLESRRKIAVVAKERAQAPAVTLDGTQIAVLANVGSSADTERAMQNGAEGVGLYRTEHAYLGRAEPPGEEELLLEMRAALAPAMGREVGVRLLDIGADKPLPFIGFLAESNPALGRRGIRLLRAYPGLLETQLRALLHLAEECDLSLIVPMVSDAADLDFVREMLAKIGVERGVSRLPRLGAMIETPGAALSVPELRGSADFFSVGTNDLTQYAFAVDRDSAAVEEYFNDRAPAIYRLVRQVVEDSSGLPVTVCGELAGRVEAVEELLRCGVRRLSVAPPLIPQIKERLRACHA